MSGSNDLSSPQPVAFRYCPKCGTRYQGTSTVCSRCTREIQPAQLPTTQPLNRPPTTIPQSGGPQIALAPSHRILLQFLPSGLCIPVSLDQPAILGRLASLSHATPDRLIDLSHLGAEQHGVSRRHCQLERQGDHLFVSDLNSTNGTYLNGARLVPHRPYRLADGDRLILSTLHTTVSFISTPARLS